MNSLRENLFCQYRYDGLDRLIGNELPDRPTLQRFYCKSRLATEIQGATQHSIIQHNDLLLAQQQRQGNALGTTLLATDLQRSVLHTLKKDLQHHPIVYSPYGHRPAFSGLLSLLGFNGERPDPVTGYYLLGNGYRAFNPVLMRFNSPDSWSPFTKGGLNSYAYCLGEPIGRRDPTGHRTIFRMSRPFRLNSPPRQRVAHPTPGPARNMNQPNTHSPFPDKSPPWTTSPPPASAQSELRPPSSNTVVAHTSSPTAMARRGTQIHPAAPVTEHPLPSYASATAPPPNYKSLSLQAPLETTFPTFNSERIQDVNTRSSGLSVFFRSLIHNVRGISRNIRRNTRPQGSNRHNS